MCVEFVTDVKPVEEGTVAVTFAKDVWGVLVLVLDLVLVLKELDEA